MSKVLLIGNGPSALEQGELGSRIDSNEFDKVVRFNRWKFDNDGSEHKTFNSLAKYVGTRCDIWVVNDLHMQKPPGGCSMLGFEKKDLYEMTLVVTPNFKWDSNFEKDVTNIHNNIPNIRFIDPSFENNINKIVDFRPQWPSTGTVAIAFFSVNFDEVYLHGVDCYDIKYAALHYFEDKDQVLGKNNFKTKKDKSDHTPDKDKEFIKYVIKNKNVKILK